MRKRAGGCIAAGERLWADPMMPVGDTSAVRRAVIAFTQAGLFPVVVVADKDDRELRTHLANKGVVFLAHEDAGPHELFDSVRLGLEFLRPLCDRVAFTPVNAPVFSLDTLTELLERCETVAQPSYQGHAGHPVVLAAEVIPQILAYQGPDGLRGAIRTVDARSCVGVEDEGVLTSVFDDERLARSLAATDSELQRPELHLRLERDEPFFDDRAKLLLFLVGHTGNLRRSCALMGLSYAKGWDLVNRLEAQLGFAVVNRRRGGAQGGATSLTPRGEEFLEAYLDFEAALREDARRQFRAHLGRFLS